MTTPPIKANCPFCGADQDKLSYGEGKKQSRISNKELLRMWINCEACGASGPQALTLNSAITGWNLRSNYNYNAPPARYVFRNLPCNIQPDEALWCVRGRLNDPTEPLHGGGVLEWCYNEGDAKERLAMMERDPRFSNLQATSWLEVTKHIPGFPQYKG